MGDVSTLDGFLQIVRGAKERGLPVSFLLVVGKSFPPVFTDDLSCFHRDRLLGWDELRLNKGLMRSLKPPLSPDAPYGEASWLGTLYHEATHAYFHLLENDPRIKALVAEGIAYYAGAPIQRSARTVTDPERVVQEAAGDYAGTRVYVWWSTFEALYALGVAKDLSEGKIGTAVSEIAGRYDDALKNTQLGYQTEPATWNPRTWVGERPQTNAVAKPILPSLKRFIDQVLLEEKIPDLFGQVAFFRALVEEMRAALREGRAAALVPAIR